MIIIATSGYTDVTVASYIKLRFSWNAGSQSITNNYTPVTWKLQLISSNSSANINSSASKDWSVTVNGTTKSGTNTVGLSGGATKTLASGSINIYHNSNGTKSFNYSFSQEFAITYSGSAIGTKSGSGSGTLNTIPRGSVLGTISAFTFGNAVNIPITKYSSSFTDTLVISVGGTTIKTISDIDNGYDVSFSATELNNIYAKLPSATSGTVTFKLTTKNGSTTIGTSTKTAKGTIPSTVKPSISNVALSEYVSGIASKFGAYIQGKSRISGTITASAGSGSSIDSYKIVINGATYTSRTFTTGVLNTSGTGSSTNTKNRAVVTVTDKRGRTASSTVNFTVLAYTKPTISTFKVERCNADGTLNDEGINFKVTVKSSITALDDKNDSAYLLQYKLSSVDDWISVGTSLSGYSVNTNFVVTNIALNIDNVYDFRLTVSDYFEDVPKNYNVPESFTLMNFGPDGHSMAIGGVAEETDTLDIKMKKTYISDNAYMGGNARNDNEKNLYIQSTGNGEYNHNCKLYGGNGTSATSIGMWDSLNSHLIFRYLCSTEEFHFSADMNILRGGKPIIIEDLFNYGANSGNFRLNDGFCMQWGKVSLTPTAANTVYNLDIKFPTAFTTKPNIFIIPQSSVPDYIDCSIGQSSAGLDEFSIYMKRTTATATSFHWVAIGRTV